MSKKYTIQVSGLILGNCDGTLRDAQAKAGRLARGYSTEVDIYCTTGTRTEWVGSVNGQGEIAYPVAV